MSEMLAFSAQQVCRLTGLSQRQLRYWDQSGFFTPQYADDNRRRPYSRIYSFQDVVGLRTIALLLNKYRVPFRELQEVGAWLARHCHHPWSSKRFYVVNRHVVYDDPATGERVAGGPPAQLVLPIELDKIAGEMREAASQLRERGQDEIGQISKHRYVVRNADVVAGTRVPTSAIWHFHEAGYSPEEIVAQYPRLTVADVHAAIAHEEEQRQQRAG